MTSLNISKDLQLPDDLATESNGILGKKGSGKTSAGVVLFEEMYAARVPVVAVDPKGDWYGIRSTADGTRQGLPVPVFGGLHGDIPLEATGGFALATLIREQHMSCILDVSEFSAAERRKFLTPFADHLYRTDDRTPMHLILEEAHEYIPQRVDSGDAAMVGVFERLVKNGRFKGIGVTMLSQRSASLNKNVLTQVDNLFIMRTTSPQDRAAVKLWIDTAAGDDRDDILRALPSLENGECWLWQPSRGEPVRFRFRMRRTFDAGATPKIGEVRAQPTNLANVDLTAISAAMAETIEKAKADDPRELRRQVADLTKRLAEQQSISLRLQTEKPEPVIECVDRPVLSDGEREYLGSLLAELTDALNVTNKALIAAGTVVSVVKTPPARAAQTVAPRVVMTQKLTEPKPQAVIVEGELKLGKAHRAILTVLAQRGTQSAQQVATLSGYAVSGGGFANAIGALRSAGYISGGKDALEITEIGVAGLGDFEPIPTGRSLVDFWLGKFGRAERLILEQLTDAWPAGMTKDDLAEATGYAASGGGFANAIGKLRGLTLINGTKDGLFADDELGQAAHS